MDEYEEQIRKMVEEARARGETVTFEVHNESHHGQAAINIMNGLPGDADPSEVKGCFNDFLQDVIPTQK